ncbi:hypothetical protein IWQ62_002427 [Dispira parvispora]|uniref:Uncharacterized protein n=1 Tax=Dispira parvispora TaxID=1520584 RepID=A0A9W8E7H4_9FUNG|nr:hypothetical protein IWQ62_002427 [Dispira parvispora]
MKPIVIALGTLLWLNVYTHAGILDVVYYFLGISDTDSSKAWCDAMFNSLQPEEARLLSTVVAALCTSSHKKSIPVSVFKQKLRELPSKDVFALVSNEIQQLGYMIHKDYLRLPNRRNRFEEISKKERKLTDEDVKAIKEKLPEYHQTWPLCYDAVMSDPSYPDRLVDHQSSFLLNVHVYQESKKTLSDEKITLRPMDFTAVSDKDLLRVSPYMLALRQGNYAVAEALVQIYQLKLRTPTGYSEFRKSSIKPFFRFYRDYFSEKFKCSGYPEEYSSAFIRNAHENMVKNIFWPVQAMIALLNEDVGIFRLMLSEKVQEKSSMYHDIPKELVFLAVAKNHSEHLFEKAHDLLKEHCPDLFTNFPEETRHVGEDNYSFKDDFLQVYHFNNNVQQFIVVDVR